MPADKFAGSEATRGLVMVITGNGKGKTTSAFGQALRAAGHGYRICIIQFMKGRPYGEVLAMQKYLPNIKLFQFGRDSFVRRDYPDTTDVNLARRGLEKAREVVHSGDFNMVILDEINVAVDFNLIPEAEILDLVKEKPPVVDLIMTGRYASTALQELADIVSEVVEVKHHYFAGVKSRPGIEY